jgi:predicted AAA+ superfamily ATPase
MHALLNIHDGTELERHPKAGASWEGFILHDLCVRFSIQRRERFYWRSVSGAELDLLAVRGRHRIGFEIKRTTAPALTPSMRSALSDLKLGQLFVIHAGDHAFDLARNVHAVPATGLKSIKLSGFKQ